MDAGAEKSGVKYTPFFSFPKKSKSVDKPLGFHYNISITFYEG